MTQSGVKGLDGHLGTRDLAQFDPRKIRVDRGFNPRSPLELRKNVDRLKPQILAEGGVQQPLWVWRDGSECVLMDGESRLTAVLELIREGKLRDEDFPKGLVTVPVLYFAGMAKEGDRALAALTANGGKPLERWEIGLTFARLVNLHWTVKDIAERRGVRAAYVTECIALAESSDEVKEMMSAKLLSESAVVKAVREHGSKAEKVLKEKVDANGGARVRRHRTLLPTRREMAATERLRTALERAAHFFDSPASFSHEEFRGVAMTVYEALGKKCQYKGFVPHLEERTLAEKQLKEALQERKGGQ